MQKRKLNSYSLVLAAALIFCSCKKLAEVSPPVTSINSENVYSSDATAIAAVTNIYTSIAQSHLTNSGIASLSLYPSLSADELSVYSGYTNNAGNYFYQNNLSATRLNSPDYWACFYQTIYITNTAIEGLSISASLSPSVKQQLLGEVKFMRAFCYFYLVNLYGDVPLILTSDYKVNSVVKRASASDVYKQIIIDLKDAQTLLSDQYLDATLLKTTSEKIRPTRWAATSLLARIDLYTKDYSNAIIESSKIINGGLFSLSALNAVFSMNSAEAIWQLQPVNSGWNTEDAFMFILPSNGPDAGSHPFYLSQQLLTSFETGDQRKVSWTKAVTVANNTYYYPYKYKSASYNDPITEYEMVFRLAEQYLIRAEAEAQLNQVNEARNDVYAVRNRAGLSNTTATDKTSLLGAILYERQVELFTEWGHRWFDLKRTGNVDVVMGNVTPQKGGTWNTNWQWYPISTKELTLNPNLVQNAGY